MNIHSLTSTLDLGLLGNALIKLQINEPCLF